MSRGSSKSSTKTQRGGRRPETPLDATLLKRAAEIVKGYRLVIQSSPTLGYMGYTAELSGVMGGGRTIEACARSVLEAQAVVVALMLEAGERPPAPAAESKRQTQVNIRMTNEEKLLLESAAQRQGFRNVSEFLRTAGLRASEAA